MKTLIVLFLVACISLGVGIGMMLAQYGAPYWLAPVLCVGAAIVTGIGVLKTK